MPFAPDMLDRFRADLEALVGPPERIGVAVSGGPDSLALLLLADAAYPGRVAAATVDHGLRPEGAEEARFVASVCERLGCPHAILAVAVAPGGEGVQGEARRARYAALRQWAEAHRLPLLLTAHHADDQAETILMRLQRGSGVAGLSAIRPVRPEGATLHVVRPLLGWPRADLAEIVARARLGAVDDPSNRDPRYDRVAMRDFLAANPRFEPARLARSAAALREADEALGWMTDALAAERCTLADGVWRIDVAGLPREIRRRLLHRAVAAVRREAGLEPPWTGGEDVEGLLAALESGAAATLAGVMARGGPAWQIRLAPPRRATGRTSS